jgi:hypothetical protein
MLRNGYNKKGGEREREKVVAYGVGIYSYVCYVYSRVVRPAP